MREPHFGIRVVHFAVIAVVSTAAFAADPPTAASLSVKLTEHCTALRTKFEEGTPALGANDCKQAGDTPTKEELAACREVLGRISTNAFAPVAKLMTTHHDAIRSEFSDKSKTIQQLHIIFAGREAQFRKVVAEAAAGFWKDFAPPNATTKLRDAATQAKLDEAEKAVGEKLFSACLAADATIIEAAFPSPATLEDLAASSTRLAQQAVSDAERDAFAEFTKAEGFTRSVECLWSTKTENGQTRTRLQTWPARKRRGSIRDPHRRHPFRTIRSRDRHPRGRSQAEQYMPFHRRRQSHLRPLGDSRRDSTAHYHRRAYAALGEADMGWYVGNSRLRQEGSARAESDALETVACHRGHYTNDCSRSDRRLRFRRSFRSGRIRAMEGGERRISVRIR